MLFIQSNSLPLVINEGDRLRLLDILTAKGFTPLIRSARRHCFELLVSKLFDAAFLSKAVVEMEHECAAQHESEGGTAYTPGEIFCTSDCVFSIIFGESAEQGLSAVVVYSVDTVEPLLRFEYFCRDVRDAFGELGESEVEATAKKERQMDLPLWETLSGRQSSQGLTRFIAIQPTDFVRAAAAFRGNRQLMRASELMEENSVRSFLRRVQEMRREGYTPRRLFTEAGAVGDFSIEEMMDAGLLIREVRVSCRKSGHALFDMPSSDSLAAITISKAKCSLCAAPVADEVIEETINPTRLAVSLLEDGTWLNNRVYEIIHALGIPDSEIATGPASPHGESFLAVDVCGNSFLFVTKDGDLTPAFCRRIGEIVEETEASHLVAIVTGTAEDEGRLRLYEFAWRRARAGQDLDTTLIEGLGTLPEEIERAFGRAVHCELSRHLFPLNAALGSSASNFVLDWFKLTNNSGAKRREADLLPPLFIDTNHRVAS
ncbi:MAG: hypothetical protein WBP93_16770 [Pyrinomonadaceae bacterium]